VGDWIERDMRDENVLNGHKNVYSCQNHVEQNPKSLCILLYLNYTPNEDVNQKKLSLQYHDAPKIF
jgi:hypothetical protein